MKTNHMKILSVLLALILALSSITALPASAAVSESFTPDPGKLYFDTDGTGWDMSTTKNKVAFYIFGGDFGTEDNPIEPVTWGSKKAIGSAVAGETGVFEFDPVAKEGLSFTPGVQYKIIFAHTSGNNWGAQTYDLYFTTDCFGKVAYADGTTTENPVDSSKSTQTAYWSDIDPEVNGPVLAITSIGNVVGSCPEQGKTKYDVLVDFISEVKDDYNGRTGLENARYYTVESNIKTEQEMIDDIAAGLGLTKEDVSRAFEETGVETTWSPDAEPSTEPPTESFEYSIIESGYASIKRYNGKDAVVEVPSEFDGNKIEAIEESAFKDNTFITKVTLPDTINSIGYDAFKGCTSLAEINIPAGVSDGALEGCTALTDLYVNRDVELNGVFGNGTLPENLTIHGYTNSKAEFFANENNIPFDSIGEIPESDHYSYMILNGKDAAVLCSYSGYQKVVEIPDTYEGYPVTVIGMGAFLNNTNVEEIVLPDSVTEIRNEYLDQPTDIFFGAFEGCTSLKKINIPDGVTEIVGNTFKGCTSLTEITIPDSVTTIEDSAFDTSRLLTIYGYDGSAAQTYADQYENFTFVLIGTVDDDFDYYTSDGNAYITRYKGSETHVVVPNELNGYPVIEITNWLELCDDPYCKELHTTGAFENTDVQSVTLPDTVQVINDRVFFECEALTDVNMPTELTTIGESAFFGCTSLNNVNFPEGLTAIGNLAFRGCVSMTELHIPASTVRIGELSEGSADNEFFSIQEHPYNITSCAAFNSFDACSGLQSITVDENNPLFDSRDNCNAVIRKENNKLLLGCQNTVIPASVPTIGANAFKDCTGLTELTIPTAVSSICGGALSGCKGLQKLVVPEQISYDDLYRSFVGIRRYFIWNGKRDFLVIEKDPDINLTIYGYYGTGAEKYAAKFDIPFRMIAPATSDEVSLDAPEGYTYSVVKKSTDDEASPDEDSPDEASPDEADPSGEQQLPKGSILLSVYDITLRDTEDETPVQPESPVTVRIRCDNPNARVYRREADGSLTDMNARYENGYYVFEADHFSEYLIVQLAAEVDLAICGDADGDGEVTALDATMIQRYNAKIATGIPAETLMRGDVNGDGDLDIIDVTLIQRFLAKMNVKYPIGEALS